MSPRAGIKSFVLGMMILLLPVLATGCSQNASNMYDGYYSAEAGSFDADGWKEYVSIYVSNNKIITVEYDAHNASGLLRSWDMDYMHKMFEEKGIYPNEFTRAYSVSLLNWQDPDDVPGMPGAEYSHGIFQRLTKAAIAQAKEKNKQVAIVDIED